MQKGDSISLNSRIMIYLITYNKHILDSQVFQQTVSWRVFIAAPSMLQSDVISCFSFPICFKQSSIGIIIDLI